MNLDFQLREFDETATILATENQLFKFRRQFKEKFKIDIADCINIEFRENETKFFLEEHFALSYLRNAIDIPPQKIENPAEYPELHSELCNQDYEIPSIDQFDKFKMPVNPLQASFLIEIFCPNQQSTEKASYVKQYMTTKTVYTLLLIAPLPVCFEIDPTTQYCVISFADTTIASAQMIQEQVKFALGIFTAKICYASFNNVDCLQFSLESTQQLSESLDCAVLRSPNSSVSEGSGQFFLYFLPNVFGQAERSRIKNKVSTDVYPSIQLFQCENCHKYVSQNSKEECFIAHPENPNEDMVFDSHTLTGISASQFQFGVF